MIASISSKGDLFLYLVVYTPSQNFIHTNVFTELLFWKYKCQRATLCDDNSRLDSYQNLSYVIETVCHNIS